eukprot:g27229.t1
MDGEQGGLLHLLRRFVQGRLYGWTLTQLLWRSHEPGLCGPQLAWHPDAPQLASACRGHVAVHRLGDGLMCEANTTHLHAEMRILSMAWQPCDLRNTLAVSSSNALALIERLALGETPKAWPLWGDLSSATGVLDLTGKIEDFRGDEGAAKLAEVLPTTQVTSLLLGFVGIGPDGAASLAKVLPSTKITTLNLAGNQIQDEGALKLAEVLPMTQIHTLNLDRNVIYTAKSLVESLPKTKVTTLSLGLNPLGIHEAEKLAEVLPETRVTTLDMRQTHIGHKGAAALAKALPRMKLTALNLNKVSHASKADWAMTLAEGLAKTQLTTLNMSGNVIGDEAAVKLADALPETKITMLDLGAGSIGEEGGVKLAEALPKTQVTTLDLHDNDMGGLGIQQLAKALPGTQITTLNLQETSIGDEGTEKLAETLAKTKITTLDLKGNDIGLAVSKLAEVLPDTQVSTLNLGYNFFEEEGMEKLIEILPKTQLATLHLAVNHLGPDCVAKLAAVMPKTIVTTLDLGFTNIGPKGAEKLAEVLPKTHVTTLLLGSNDIGNEGPCGAVHILGPHSELIGEEELPSHFVRLRRWSGGAVLRVSWSPEATLLAALHAGQEPLVRLWKTQSWEEHLAWLPGFSLAWLNGDTLLATGGGHLVEIGDSPVQEVAVCPRTAQRVAVRLDGCREVLIYERATCGLAGWSHRELMPCGRLAAPGAFPQALAFAEKAKAMGSPESEGSLLAVHWLFDCGHSEVRTYPFHYLPAKLLQNSADETFFLEIFPDSSKLDAYAMAFDDIQVFEEAGSCGDACYLRLRIAQKFEPGLPIQKERHTEDPRLALAAKRFLDLGSGDGRAVIAAAVLVPSLSESLGVELSMSRHQLAVKNRSRLPDALQDVVHFQQCDILQVEPALLGGTEIVWLANLRFPDETVLAINKYLDAHCRSLNIHLAWLRQLLNYFETKSIVLDANWRWLHNGEYTNCYKDGDFDKSLCPDPLTCAQNCHLEGNSEKQYKSTYGIKAANKGIGMGFVTETEYGANYGSRVYMLDGPDKYKLFKLKNREFTLTVDMFYMPCGLNGAVYFVEMDADGGKAAAAQAGGINEAGAKYGTGYCDAQCPHDIKFMAGKANSGWNSSHDPPIGKYGACCAEMDIWEANSRATAYTPHPCSITGTYVCEGVDCGDNSKDERYDGVCDKDGCDFNSWRLGEQRFYGRGSGFEVDSRRKMTVVTQFITEGNRDDGDLIDIRRFYVQDGKVIPNSNVSIAGITGNSDKNW